MLFGFNTNVKAGDSSYHVQTEDRGLANALIDTTVYCGGRIIHRRTGNYLDLLPLDAEREEELRLRLEDQHRGIVEDIRSGDLPVAPPPKSQMREVSSELKLTLINARSWLAGKRATLQIAVQDQAGEAVPDANIIVRVEGAAVPAEFTAATGPDGRAQLEFDMPRLASEESTVMPAVAIEAACGGAKGNLRFQLRAKLRAPSAI